MTMPHLMNCPHMGDAHCLDCVKRDWEAKDAEIERLKRFVDGQDLRSDFKTATEMREEIERLKEYSKGSFQHRHELYCNANHNELPGGGACSCPAGKEIRRLRKELSASEEKRKVLGGLVARLGEIANDYANQNGHTWDGQGCYKGLYKDVKEAADATNALDGRGYQ